MTTGRTPSKYVKLQIEGVDGALHDIPIRTFGDIGLTEDEVDLSAVQDAVKGMAAGQANFGITITGPFDNTAIATASATGEAAGDHLSGSHTVLAGLNGLNVSRAFGVYFGILADWATGDPVFGADNCVTVTGYTVNPDSGLYSATIRYLVRRHTTRLGNCRNHGRIMSKVITSPVKRWAGTVTICTDMLLPQAEAVDEGMTQLPPDRNGRVTYTSVDKLHLPAILACVEKWELSNFPTAPNLDNWPMSPLPDRHKLIEWLWDEIKAVYLEEADIPNELSPTLTDTQVLDASLERLTNFTK